MNGSVVDDAQYAAQIIIATIPLAGIVMGSVVIFFYLLWRHHQIVRLISIGAYTKPVFDLYLFSILTGFLLTGTGLSLSVLFLCIGGVSYILLGGLIPLSLGVSLIAFYIVTRPNRK